jgi:hypothetical protein
MDADSSDSADLVLVALSAPRSRPPPARPRRATRAGPPPVGPVRSTPERTRAAGAASVVACAQAAGAANPPHSPPLAARRPPGPARWGRGLVMLLVRRRGSGSHGHGRVLYILPVLHEEAREGLRAGLAARAMSAAAPATLLAIDLLR